VTQLDPEDLLSLTSFLGMLPGVKPRSARELLTACMHDAIWEKRGSFTLGPVTIPVGEANEFFIRDDRDVQHVSPRGAALLIKLYEAGELPMKTKRVQPTPDEALAYMQSEKDLVAKGVARREQEAAARQAYQAKIADPASITEAEFTYHLLDDIFWQHQGKGGGTLMVGGIEVHKSVSTLSSNSGKSSDSAVRFSWTSPANGLQQLSKPSAYEENRRNDADRNWGLPG